MYCTNCGRALPENTRTCPFCSAAERNTPAEVETGGSVGPMTEVPPSRPSTDEFICPRCGGNACKRWEFPSLGIVHWLLNPGVAVAEILVGTRVPRTTYICIKCDAPLVLRTYLRCPKCGTYHSLMLWGRSNGYGHWFGLFCPDCGARIPTLLNVLSVAVAVPTAVLWYPVWRGIRSRWIPWEQRRAARQRARGAGQREPVKHWILYGTIAFGLLMWVFTAVPQYFDSANAGSVAALLLKLPLWLAVGALWGFFMKLFLGRRHRFRLGHCRSCGYDLRGLPSNTCPECGFRFDQGDLGTTSLRRPAGGTDPTGDRKGRACP